VAYEEEGEVAYRGFDFEEVEENTKEVAKESGKPQEHRGGNYLLLSTRRWRNPQ